MVELVGLVGLVGFVGVVGARFDARLLVATANAEGRTDSCLAKFVQRLVELVLESAVSEG